MQRRRFLQLAAATGVCSSLAWSREYEWDVIVLGAGVSGLGAARWLHRKDYRVLVLEARQRVGGRVATDRSLGFSVDLGASWIEESEGNPTSALAREAGIRLVDDPDSWAFVQTDGSRLDLEAENRLQRLVRAIEDGSERDPSLSIGAAAQKVLSRRNLSEEDHLLLREYYHGCLTENGAAADEVSVLANYDDGYSGVSKMFPDGYDQIPRFLARDLQVQLGQVVRRVEWGPRGTVVSTERGQFRSRSLVVSLPLGVLRSNSVVFDPPLPESQQFALRSMRMGLLNKVVLRYPRAFWPDTTEHFAYLSKDYGVLGEWVNLHALFGQKALMVFLGGQPAWRREAWTDRQILDEAAQVAHRMFGGPPPDGGIVTRWGRDPYTRGCYSYLPPGVTRSAYASLARPHPPLFFAGEASNETQPGTVHGAYLSGLRAAKEVDEAWD